MVCEAMVLMSTHVMNKGEFLVLMACVGVDALFPPTTPRFGYELLSFSRVGARLL